MKSKLIVFTKKSNVINIDLPGVQKVTSLKLLGVTFTNGLLWNEHIENVVKRCSTRMYALRILKKISDIKTLKLVYTQLILSIIEYCSPVFINLNQNLKDDLETIRKRCHRIIDGYHCAGVTN